MKKHLIHIFFLLLIGTASLSCARDMGTRPDSPNNSKVEVSFLLNLSQREQLKSTSDDSLDPDQIYLLVFEVNTSNEPTILRERVKALPGSSANNFTAELTPTEDKRIIYIAANFTIAEGLVGSSFVEVQKALKTADLKNNGTLIESMPSSHPMISNPYPFESITGIFTMGTTDAPVKLYRNTVKINASTEDLMAGALFELESISLYNAPVSGYLFHGVESVQKPTRYNYANDLTQTWNSATKKTGDILCYEASLQDDKNPFVIIKGKYDGHDGYYMLEFIQEKKEIDLLRNCYFTFNIKNVQRAGYATIDEAILNTASNGIEYNVLIKDIFSTDIVSNGEQYLGVSNSELVIHSDNGVAAENVLAVTVSYTMKPSWTTPGKITYSAGITPITGAEIPLPQSGSGILQDMDIYISMTNANITTGTITISIGDLRKVVTVRRSQLPSHTPMTYNGGDIELTHQNLTGGKPILIGEIVDPHTCTWIRLAKEGGKPARAKARSKVVLVHDATGQPSDNLFIHVWGNEEAMYTSSTLPRGYFFISYANDHGRTRYCVLKEVTELNFNANGGFGQPGNVYEWVKQSDDNGKAYILLPQAEPQRDKYIFKGWTKKRDGTGDVFAPNQLYTTTFAAKDTLFAKWTIKPVLIPYIFAGSKYWAVGNLVADGENAAKIGTPTDNKLMFKFGSLIGFDIDSKTATLIPDGCTITPNIESIDGTGYTKDGSSISDNVANGQGDPCSFYLGSTWRLPATADYDALNLISISGMQADGLNEKGETTKLIIPKALSYLNNGFAGAWEFLQYSRYQTKAITQPYAFNDSGKITGGDGFTDSHLLGAVRCVRDDNPNIPQP